MRITSSGNSSASIFSGKSVLLSKIMRLLSLLSSRRARSWSVSASELLRTRRTKSASSRAFLERSTPIFSTTSSVSRIPAVSTNFKGTPLMLTYSSITSRVVPSMSVTMALSSRSRLFKRLDFPTFGRPMIAVDKPSRRILPRFAVAKRFSKRLWNSCVFSRIRSVVISSTSSYSG